MAGSILLLAILRDAVGRQPKSLGTQNRVERTKSSIYRHPGISCQQDNIQGGVDAWPIDISSIHYHMEALTTNQVKGTIGLFWARRCQTLTCKS